jgi:hypothetical protein
MSMIENFCSYMVTDIKMASSPQQEPSDATRLRITNLALRIIGLTLGAIALSCAIGALGTAVICPISAACSLITSVFIFVIAHDMVVVGHNRSEIMNSAAGFGGALWNSIWGLTPRDFQNTWIAGSVYTHTS